MKNLAVISIQIDEEPLSEIYDPQKTMYREMPVLKARYEDLCLDPSTFLRVFQFVESDITEVGELGNLLGSDDKRVEEGKMHDGKVTDQRVARWATEPDTALVEEATAVFRAMPEYCEFWEYSA